MYMNRATPSVSIVALNDHDSVHGIERVNGGSPELSRVSIVCFFSWIMTSWKQLVSHQRVVMLCVALANPGRCNILKCPSHKVSTTESQVDTRFDKKKKRI